MLLRLLTLGGEGGEESVDYAAAKALFNHQLTPIGQLLSLAQHIINRFLRPLLERITKRDTEL